MKGKAVRLRLQERKWEGEGDCESVVMCGVVCVVGQGVEMKRLQELALPTVG